MVVSVFHLEVECIHVKMHLVGVYFIKDGVAFRGFALLFLFKVCRKYFAHFLLYFECFAIEFTGHMFSAKPQIY
jgi:hypothetical protein